MLINNHENYYLTAFDRLEKSKTNTWNWSAFFFGGFWILYRKMYLYAFILIMGVCIIPLSYSMLTDIGLSEIGIISASSILVLHILLGYFGNALYYRLVKKRVSEGYHLLEEYKNTSLALPIFWFFVGPLKMNAFLCGADRYELQSFLKEQKIESEKFQITRENIEKYLEKNEKNHLWGKIAIGVAIVMFLLKGLFVVMNSKTEQQAKITTERIETIKNEGLQMLIEECRRQKSPLKDEEVKELGRIVIKAIELNISEANDENLKKLVNVIEKNQTVSLNEVSKDKKKMDWISRHMKNIFDKVIEDMVKKHIASNMFFGIFR